MANRANIGFALGNALAGGGQSRNDGYSQGIKNNALMSDIELNRAKTADQIQQTGYGSDDNIIGSILSKIGANNADGINDFKASMAGNYKPLMGAPTEQQRMDGNSAIPQPSYVSKLPDATKEFATLKQMLALGDKNYTNISKAAEQENINRIGADITPDNAFGKSQQLGVLQGKLKPEDLIQAQLVDQISKTGKPFANETALSLSKGKGGVYDNMGDGGTYNSVDGSSVMNPQAQKESSQKNAYSVPVQTAKGIFAFDTRAQKMVQMTDENGNPVVGSNSDTNLQKNISASKEEGKLIGKDKGNVISKQDALYSVKKAKELLKKGIYAGGFADIKSGIAKYTPLGDDEKLANTQTFVSEIGNTVVPRLQEFGGNDSNEEMRYLKSIMGGDITVEPETLKNVLDSVEFKIQRGIDRATKGLNADGLPKNSAANANNQDKQSKYEAWKKAKGLK